MTCSSGDFLYLAGTDGFLGFDRAAGGDFGDVSFGVGADVELFAQLGVHFGEGVGVVAEEGAGVFAPLSDALAGVAVPGAGLLDDVVGHGHVEHFAFAADAFAVEDVELGLAEGGGDLVLDDLDLGAVAGDDVAVFDGGDAADIDSYGGVKLEGAATLFLTILTLVRLPVTTSPSLMAAMRRMSMRTEE